MPMRNITHVDERDAPPLRARKWRDGELPSNEGSSKSKGASFVDGLICQVVRSLSSPHLCPSVAVSGSIECLPRQSDTPKMRMGTPVRPTRPNRIESTKQCATMVDSIPLLSAIRCPASRSTGSHFGLNSRLSPANFPPRPVLLARGHSGSSGLSGWSGSTEYTR